MSEQTGISWTDHTFNPWWGCVKVSPACASCYAERDSKRYGFKVWGPESDRRFFSAAHWNEPLRWNAVAEKLGVRKRVFCASMADVFEVHANPVIQDEMNAARIKLAWTIRRTPGLDWLLLTKRPENIEMLFPPDLFGGDTYPANVWMGVTAENQKCAEQRIHILQQVPARVRFISYEPALGPLDLRPWLDGNPECPVQDPACTSRDGECHDACEGHGLHWLIAGGESGHAARPSHPEWMRSVRDQCQAAGVAFHFKQWGEWLPGHQYTGALAQKDSGDQISRFDCRDFEGDRDVVADQLEEMSGHEVYRVGKKAAGRLLDGREWNEFPEVVA